MLTIGILGANGQVGSEVCLFLSQMEDVRVIPICRTELGSTLLRRCGLACRHGELNKPSEAARLLADCDLVADFTLPQNASVGEIRRLIQSTISATMEYAPERTRFVYISSLVAFGFGPPDHALGRYLLARTLYGATKRYAERLAFRSGKRRNREVYVLRLGQVHGELQSVSQDLLRGLEGETAYVPAGRSYAVFAFTIAEALVRIAYGEHKPGRYTLVSTPDWTWKEVYEYYAKRRGFDSEIVTFDVSSQRRRHTALNEIPKRLFAKPVVDLITRYRELITGYVLRFSPRLERRFKAEWGSRAARREVAEMLTLNVQAQYRPFNVYEGSTPGDRLGSLSDCRSTMKVATDNVRRMLQSVVTTQKISASSSDIMNEGQEKEVVTLWES